MTTPRDPDALLSAYLAEGMEVLPDRVVDAVLDEVHRANQRVPRGPWRTSSMRKIAVGATAVIAVLVLGGAVWLAASRPGNSVGGPSTSPSPSASGSSSPSSEASPSPSLGPREFPSSVGSTVTIGDYQTTKFSQPMSFAVPDIHREMGPGEEITGFIYGNRHTMQIVFEHGNAGITVHDDFRINTQPCRPTEEVQEVPETPEAVGVWLHGLAEMEVTDQPDVVVDGRVAKVYDLVNSDTCGSDAPPSTLGNPDIWFGAGETHRVYAVPTGTDTILVISWNLGRNLLPTQLNPVVERFVRSFEFD